jgi:hypothetical protein
MAKRTSNPRNPQSDLFRKLTRLLSGPLATFRRQNPRRMPRGQLDFQSSRFTSASGQQFKKSQFSQNGLGTYSANYMSNQNRFDRYADFDQMEYTPEIASAMDIYADEITTSTELTPLLDIKTPDEEIKLELNTLFHNVLNINFNLFGWARSLCKYGDFFLYLDIDEKDGIKHVLGLPTAEVERIEGEDEENPDYVQYQWNSAGMTLENWQVAHFRTLGNDKHTPYGTSMLDSARRIWRQLTLIEDAVMAYRIVRSPERRVFYVDVGNIPPADVEQYMQKVMTNMKRNQIVDPNSGKVDLRYNPLSIEEDYFIPVRGDTSSKVETLAGGAYTGDIDDVKYLRDKLFTALKVPASYLTRSEGGDEDKATLAQKDIRFARTVQRLQRSVTSELEKIAVIHLFARGYRGKDLTSFKLRLNNPSKLAQLQELEHWKTKFDTAAGATEGYFSKRWVAENIFNLSEEEMLRIKREMFHDRKFEATLEKVAEEIATGGGALGGDLGGEDLGGDLGGEELGDEELAGEAAEGGDELEAEEESTLLAAPPDPDAPAKRDDGTRTKRTNTGKKLTKTSKSKDWYMPKQSDRRDAGARSRNIKSQALPGMDPRALHPGWKGKDGLKGLGYGITENLQTTYSREEEEIMQVNNEIKDLIRLMESKKTDEVPA